MRGRLIAAAVAIALIGSPANPPQPSPQPVPIIVSDHHDVLRASRSRPLATPSPRPSRAVVASLPPHSDGGSWAATKASWYNVRPASCDGRPVPRGIRIWTAVPTKKIRCGTMLELRLPGSDETLRVPVWDRGPCREWRRGVCTRPVPGRFFDLSAAAFNALGADLSQGVIRVEWRLAR